MRSSGDMKIAQLYVEHHSWLQQWLRKKLGCDELTKDVIQTTFVRLIAKRESIDNIIEPKAYLSTIANGLVKDHWRRQTIEQAYLTSLQAVPENYQPSEEKTAMAIELIVQIDELLQTLSDAVRETFIWSQLEGLTYREIASRLSVSERTVKTYMAEAMYQFLKLT